MKQNSVILFFIDGLGIGERNEFNPLSLTGNLEPLNNFVNRKHDIHHNGILVETDTRLSTPGRPQSASGQTAIYTGLNAPKLNGGHKHGFPNEKLREIIKDHSIFLQLKRLGIEDTVFANAYTPKFFEGTPRWKSATTCSVEAAGMQFRKLSDLLGRKAIFHDFSNRQLIEHGVDVPEFSPEDAAEILVGLSREHSFTLYEHFITDKIGHAMDYEWASQHLSELARFVRAAIEQVDLDKTTFILTSDHGNIENLSIRNHTLNKVPTIIWGRKKREVAEEINDLADISPAIISLLTK